MTSTNKKGETLGLSTCQALKRLREDIEDVLKSYETKISTESYWTKIQQAFSNSLDNPIGWFPISLTIFSIVILFLLTEYISAILLFCILTITITVVFRECHLRRTELHRKVHWAINEIRTAEILSTDWTIDNYPNLCSPISPCVALQWTYRDEHIVNLPWALLVAGDHIILRPGQNAPANCTEVNGKFWFRKGDVYGLDHPIEPPVKPVARFPLTDLVCRLEVTPYLETLKTTLNDCLKRPTTIYNQQRYLLVSKYIQGYGSAAVLSITLLSAILRYAGLLLADKSTYHWSEMYIKVSVSSLIPILPLLFPLMWIAINLWGVARLAMLLSIPPHRKSNDPTVFREDLDTPSYEMDNLNLPLRAVITNWIDLWCGNSTMLCRSANVVQVLGSITALCCVDKKGILSWPNPTAEKVFFLRDSSDRIQTRNSSSSSLDSTNSRDKPGTVPEVLDLTHDQHSPFKLEFDDLEWKQHINSLKPLGLAILVNTCCPDTQENYAQFCGHVTAVATLDKDLVPVTNRYAIVESRLDNFMHGRCLCELAKQIGFTETAGSIFSLEGQIASYMHLQPEVVRRDIRFTKQLQLASKVKVPFPHCLSVVLRETTSNSLQLLTQGTADIVLDCCEDFWTGKDLRPLTTIERKRAQDFYQRNALTAYCTAFSYRPLRHGIHGALGGHAGEPIAYIELPPESKLRMTTGHREYNRYQGNYDGETGPFRDQIDEAHLHHSVSTDSLFCGSLDNHRNDDDVDDVDGCFEMQCHQVFIGMVTMQYQAQIDIVQLIERLDRACIRFVHFSKENELRSRVFSEKMGLESGWNCHISLMSEHFSNLPSPKSSRSNFMDQQRFSNVALNIEVIGQMTSDQIDTETNNKLLGIGSGLEASKNLSSSAPGAISNTDDSFLYQAALAANDQSTDSDGNVGEQYNHSKNEHHQSKDSVLDDEQLHSLSCLTDSTEQSAPINFDMSNRAKLPRGIENIRPHLENVDNVPLLVSLFTDCSADATREMLSIMQSFGEIVVCLGSSASNSNAEIFLQADCSIAIEPLYPQVCQATPTYTEANILNNKQKFNTERQEVDYMISSSEGKSKWFDLKSPLLGRFDQPDHLYNPMHSMTVSPIYLSRLLNSLPCSVSICRDDPLSIVNLIELSRRFSNGLWNCIQYWACAGCSLAILNVSCGCFSLPAIITPFIGIWLMGFIVPAIAISLTHIESDTTIMHRATGKKQTEFDRNCLMFVMCFYGLKFLPIIVAMLLSYFAFMSHPVVLIETDESGFETDLFIARSYILFGIVLHFVIVSISFVHRDCSIWRRNPFVNLAWTITCIVILLLHIIVFIVQLFIEPAMISEFVRVWPIVLGIFCSLLLSFLVAEFCKYQEIKVTDRTQRRARLDFGTKLGMNSPF